MRLYHFQIIFWLIGCFQVYGQDKPVPKPVAKLQYGSVNSLGRGRYVVWQGESGQLVTARGRKIHTMPLRAVSPFVGNIAVAQTRDDRYIFLYPNGVAVFDETFDSIGPIPGTPFFKIFIDAKEGRLEGIVEQSGRLVCPAVFHAVHWGVDSVFRVKRNSGEFALMAGQGNMLTAFDFDSIGPFVGRHAKVRIGENWGIIDREGTIAYPLRCSEVHLVKGGFARVREFPHWYLHDATGTLTDTVIWQEIRPLMPGVFLFRFGSWGLVDPTGLVLTETRYDSILPAYGGNMYIFSKTGIGLIDAGGNILLNDTFVSVAAFDVNLQWATRSGDLLITDREGGSVGYFKELTVWGDSAFLVVGQDGRYVVMAHDGRVLKGPLDTVYVFNEGQVSYTIDGAVWWHFDLNLGSSSAMSSDRPYDYLGDDKWVFSWQGVFGVVDGYGDTVVRPFLEGYVKADGRLIGKWSGKYGIIDRYGQTQIPFEFDSISYHSTEDIFFVYKDSGFAFVHDNGCFVFPFERNYDTLGSFTERVALVRQEGLYGFVNRDNKLRIVPQYTDARDFNEGVAVVKISNRKWAYIDKEEILLTQPVYELPASLQQSTIINLKDGKYHVLSKTGELWLQGLDTVWRAPFQRLIYKKGTKYGYIEWMGTGGFRLQQAVFDEVISLDMRYAAGRITDKFALIDLSGQQKTEPEFALLRLNPGTGAWVVGKPQREHTIRLK